MHYCTKCGSTNVAIEAEAQWDVAHQCYDFYLTDEWDRDFCEDCYENVRTECKELTDLKDIALVAAHKPIFKSVRSNPDVSPI